jgi:hypothetical protein
VLKNPKPKTAIQLARARRRLANQLAPRLQLNLFEDRSKDADTALAELRDGLRKLGAQAGRKL